MEPQLNIAIWEEWVGHVAQQDRSNGRPNWDTGDHVRQNVVLEDHKEDGLMILDNT